MRLSLEFLDLERLINEFLQLILFLLRQLLSISAEPSSFFLFKLVLSYLFYLAFDRIDWPKIDLRLLKFSKYICEDIIISLNAGKRTIWIMTVQHLLYKLSIFLSKLLFLFLRDFIFILFSYWLHQKFILHYIFLCKISHLN